MADETKELILSLKFDTDEALKRSGAFRDSIDKDKESLSALNKEIKASQQVSQEQLLQREKLEQSIRENTKARQEEIRKVDAYVKATKNATDENGKYNGSINQLRGALSVMTAKWNDLTKEERENAEVGGVLRAETKRLSDQLKELEGSVGDNRRSVGGYLDAIRQAPGAMGKFKAGLDGIGVAMKSNPLGLLVSLLPQIAAAFNSSGEGADFFAKAMTIVNTVLQEGLKRVVGLAGAAVKLIKGDLSGAFADGKAAVSGFGDSITNAVKAGGELADQLDKLEVAESAFTASNAKNKKEIDALLIQSRNRTTSEAERIKLLEKAEKLEVKANEQALKLANDRLKLIKAENAAKQSDEDEEQKRIDEQQARIFELENQSQNIQEKIQNRKDALADAAAEREKKRKDKAAKEDAERLEQAAIKELERLENIIKLRQTALNEATQFHDELAALDKKAADDQAELDADLLSIEIENSRAKVRTAQKESDEKIQIKENEQKILTDFATAASGLAAALANESSEFAEFQEAVTLFNIGLASAEAYTKGVAAAAGQPFPLNIIAIGTTVATIATNLLQAKQLLEGSGDAPKPPKFSEGTILSGPSHANGGIQLYSPSGHHFGEAEGGESILTARVSKNPGLLAIASMINQAAGGKALAPTRYAAMGGVLPSVVSSATIGNGNAPVIDYNALAKAVAKQPIYVIPTEIRDKANAADSRKAKAGLGY